MPRYLVAFSLAGEQRELVRAIAEAVQQQLGEGRVFFDEWFEHLIAGLDADLKLQEIYGKDCELAVVCVSGHYGNKPWTKAEHMAIRARSMEAYASTDERDRMRVLPIRVGDGDVPGIPFNTIAPDVRRKSVAEAAGLILKRLREIVADTTPPADTTPKGGWPAEVPALLWPIADHAEVRDAFGTLLTRGAPWRCLLLRGPSEAGKSHITQQMWSNGLRLQGLDCGRLDLKGTADIDGALRPFLKNLSIDPPPASPRFGERLSHVLTALQKNARPTLLIFDTYEAASGEAQEWVEKELLPSLVRATWLRVVIAGQRAPSRSGAVWEPESAPVVEVQPPLPEDWYAFGKQHRADLTPEFVQTLCKHAANKASLLSQVLGPVS